MAVLYEIDFRTLPNQTLGAPGAYTVDGKTWWAKGALTVSGATLATDVVNGSGLNFRLVSGIGSTEIGQSNALAYRHLFLPLSGVDGWTSTLSYMVRARFSYVGDASNSSPLIGVTSTTSDSVGLTSAQRPNEILVGPSPASTTTALVKYKIGAGAATTATGRAGAIANNQCVVGVYHFTPRFALPGSELLASGMPTGPETWLAAQSVGVADFNGLRSNPGVLLAIDSGSTNFYVQQLRIETIGELVDSGGPTVSFLSPPPGQMSRRATIVLRVADATGIAVVQLWAAYANGITEQVYADGEFSPPFRSKSTITTIEDGKEYEFSVQRLGGWPAGPMDFIAEPVDTGGNTSVDGGS